MVKNVDNYIDSLKSPQKEICQALREIILSTFPEIEEKMRYGVPYYGDKYYIVGLKDHVNLGFSIEGLTAEEINLLEGSGKTTRHIKIKSQNDINKERIQKLLKMVKEKG
ncbi:MAG: DUF1801 domain-containing protein [Candidatus Hermodarchaeota archaeon]